jgi:hypothetical protein
MFSQNGFPPEMTADEIANQVKTTKEEKVLIMFEYQNKLSQHKELSGQQEKSKKNDVEKNCRSIIETYEQNKFIF